MDVVKGSLGLAVLKVEAITAGQEATLEANRAEIEAKVRADLADKKVAEALKVYQESRSTGDDLLVAARKAGLPTVTVAPVSAQGAGPNNGPVAGATPALVKAAFEATKGQDSDILQEAKASTSSCASTPSSRRPCRRWRCCVRPSCSA